jgi:hypothetical protein
MHKHAVRQAAATTGSPSGGAGAPSSRRLWAAPREGSAGPGASALAGTPAPRILEELDVIVRNSHRTSALERMLRNLGSAFARLWSRMMPEPPPPQSDLPPKIWFPWFLP